MELSEIVEAIEGCTLVLEDMELADPRLWAVIAALKACSESLDAQSEDA